MRGAISHSWSVILVFEAGDGGFVAALAVIEPEGDASDGSSRDPNLFGDIEVGDFFLEEEDDLPALRDIFEFFDGHEIAEESGELRWATQGGDGLEQILHVFVWILSGHEDIILLFDGGGEDAHDKGGGQIIFVVYGGGEDEGITH